MLQMLLHLMSDKLLQAVQASEYQWLKNRRIKISPCNISVFMSSFPAATLSAAHHANALYKEYSCFKY